MAKEVTGNYLRAHRQRCGLTQDELGILVGYGHGHPISKHEHSKAAPPLIIALAYEIIFEIPVGTLFVGFRLAVQESVARNLGELKTELEAGRRRANSKRSQWLANQRIASPKSS